MVADRPVEVVHTMTTSRRWAFVELRADTPLGIAAQ
jgi:hypothetical protein